MPLAYQFSLKRRHVPNFTDRNLDTSLNHLFIGASSRKKVMHVKHIKSGCELLLAEQNMKFSK